VLAGCHVFGTLEIPCPGPGCDTSAGLDADDASAESDTDTDTDTDADTDTDTDADADADADTDADTDPFDLDGDGWAATEDCDDGDPAVNPGAEEDCATRDDDDCDGVLNPIDALGCLDFYDDADADGWGTGSPRCLCEAGATWTASVSGDCDDGDPAVNPGAVEVCDDGADNDCDGTPGTCTVDTASLADGVRLTGEAAGDYAGYPVADAGDVDGDGYDDVLVGAYMNSSGAGLGGAAYLVRGGPGLTSGGLGSAITYAAAAGLDAVGFSGAGVGDVNRDGYDDMLIGGNGDDTIATDAGFAWLVLGSPSPTGGTLTTSIAYAYRGESAYDYAGYAVDAAGDLDADGYPDMVIGAYGSDRVGSAAGIVYLVPGSASPTSTDLGTVASWTGRASLDLAGISVSGCGDVDGDGYDDVVVGATGYDTSSGETGAAHLVLGDATWTSGSLSGAVTWTGEAASDQAGRDVADAGDANGDGYADVLIGAYANDDGGAEGGAAYLVLGSASPRSGSLSAEVQYTADTAGDFVGLAVDGAGDLDLDGYADLLIGAPYDDLSTGDGAGAVYVVLGGPAPASTSLSTELRLSGLYSGDIAGGAVGRGGDVDGDGDPEILVGAYGIGDAGYYAGGAFVVYTPGY